MGQEERICKMEQRLNRASAAVMRLSAALDEYEAALQDIAALDAYYGSEQWQQDLADIHLSIHPANGAGLLSNPSLYWRFNIENRMR